MKNETIQLRPTITASPEVALMIRSLPHLELAQSMPVKMQSTLDHVRSKIARTLDGMDQSGRKLFIAGPQWAREHAQEAGQAHADVIHAAYGPTYALPNRDPQNNTRAIQSNELDMFLMFDTYDNRAIGTACTVLDNGRDELGRTASLGRVGNSLIQDLRILQWLTNEDTASKTHTLFATLRTAPDRDIGASEPMRGGQGVCHIWSEMPGAVIGGFGPLYKKHGSLEQFACMSLTRLDTSIPSTVYVVGDREAQFVLEFSQAYGMGNIKEHKNRSTKASKQTVTVHVPPQELGIHTLVHADLELSSEGTSLDIALRHITDTGSPFAQLAVSIEDDTIALQQELLGRGFHGFQVVPKTDVQKASIMFGKVLDDSQVVQTFWQHDQSVNPFWGDQIPSGECIKWR